MTTKLNIGAGDVKIDGFTPVDRKLGSEAYPLAYDSDSVAEIRASHILEHFAFDDAEKALVDWVRVLEPGGRIRIAVPDFDQVIARRGRDRLWRNYLMGGQLHDDDVHRSVYDAETLRDLMERAGLKDIAPWTSDNTDTAAHPVSLNLEGRKPHEWTPPDAEGVDVKIQAVMSIPRLGFNDHWGCVTAAFRPWGIPIVRTMGAFWGQSLQNALEQSVEQGVDWIVTLDYDTVFTSQDFDTLLGIFGRHPEIDALAPLQARRRTGMPLLTRGGQTEMEVVGQPVQVDTMHFGLTLIRAEALRDLPKPWFIGIPGPDGTWTHDDHVDPDIYFWKKWKEHGKTAYVAPHVSVGHLELMVSGYDRDLTHRHQHVVEWMEEFYGTARDD